MIIGILGQMRTGKSTLARRIKDEYGADMIYSFAEPLRKECAVLLFPETSHEIARMRLAEVERVTKPLVRPLLQAVGESKRRIIDRDYWVNAVANVLGARVTDPDTIVVIDDVRHENEARFILENGGILIRLSADRETLIERGADADRLEHYSETAMVALSETEKKWAHRCLRINTSGLSPAGVFKGLRRFLNEMLWGEEE